ncbi:MAG TPA: SxtJ family membrane protein [Longimicrobiales bacterium]|nr:SxtJ family membrane protein [Longimicrobiales bacterium]
MAERVPARLSAAEGRKFGFTVGGAFAVLAGITWWRGHTVSMQVFVALAVLLLVAGALVPGKLGPVFRAWMALAHLISRVTTPIVLGIVYFLVISPTGLLMRMLGRNPMHHRPEGDSLWLTRSSGRGTMSNQF